MRNSNITYGIPKGKFDTYTVKEIKRRSNVPPVGLYDITKGENSISKGTKKSYK
jgi:hypothetical protein